MKLVSSFLLAIAVATGSAGVALAATEDQDFSVVRQSEYFLMIREGHLAWERGDGPKAEEILVKAACAGDKDSQFMLGTMYLNGEGAPADALKAYGWYVTAAEVGDSKYEAAVDKLGALIPAVHMDAAKAEAERMLKAYGLDATGQTCQMEAITGSKIKNRTCRPRLVSGQGDLRFDVRQCEAREQSRLAVLQGEG
jgi:hypothetical protein